MTLYIFLIAGGLVAIISLIGMFIRSRADKKPSNMEQVNNARQIFMSQLEEGENLKTVCRGGHSQEFYGISDRRIFIDSKKGKYCIPIRDIIKIDYKSMDGRTTTNPGSCFSLIVYACSNNTNYYNFTFYRKTELFDEFCYNLMSSVNNR